MAGSAKTTTRSKDTKQERQNVAAAISRETRELPAADRFVFPQSGKPARRGALKKPEQEKARLATFSFTPEDLRYVEKATFRVIQALETGVSKSYTVRLAMRAFASMSVEELRTLLHRVAPLT
jgi:hypothetical protein